MNRVVSVDKSLISGGTVQWHVTLEDGGGNKTRIEVSESAAQRFQVTLQSQQTEGTQRLLTETHP
jgi:hypothetical protein